MTTKLKELIGYDFTKGDFTVGTHDTKGNKLSASTINQSDVDAWLADLMQNGTVEDHELLAAQLVEPIEQVVPYQTQFDSFFQDWQLDDLEDNSIPVEDTVALAYQVQQDGEIMYTRSGFSFTRPDFLTFQTGIEVGWKAAKRAGWNYLARQMRRANEALQRKHDEMARGALLAAVPASHIYTVTGGSLTKTSVDQILKDQAAIGFPVRQVLCNPATLMAMGNFTWGGTGYFIPPEEARQLLRTLHIMDYGGAQWMSNPFVLTTELWFGGTANQIGWHQIRGSVNVTSDVNITKGVDNHAIRDAEHAYYVGNSYTLAKLLIAP
jgi:hypothetical protein